MEIRNDDMNTCETIFSCMRLIHMEMMIMLKMMFMKIRNYDLNTCETIFCLHEVDTHGDDDHAQNDVDEDKK